MPDYDTTIYDPENFNYSTVNSALKKGFELFKLKCTELGISLYDENEQLGKDLNNEQYDIAESLLKTLADARKNAEEKLNEDNNTPYKKVIPLTTGTIEPMLTDHPDMIDFVTFGSVNQAVMRGHVHTTAYLEKFVATKFRQFARLGRDGQLAGIQEFMERQVQTDRVQLVKERGYYVLVQAIRANNTQLIEYLFSFVTLQDEEVLKDIVYMFAVLFKDSARIGKDNLVRYVLEWAKTQDTDVLDFFLTYDNYGAYRIAAKNNNTDCTSVIAEYMSNEQLENAQNSNARLQREFMTHMYYRSAESLQKLLAAAKEPAKEEKDDEEDYIKPKEKPADHLRTFKIVLLKEYLPYLSEQDREDAEVLIKEASETIANKPAEMEVEEE